MFGDLPVPKKKTSWVAAIFLSMISFYIYYGFLYQGFVHAYSERIYKSREFTTISFSGSVTIPNSISAFVARPVRILIANDLAGKDSPTIEDITISVYHEPVNEKTRTSSLIFDPKKNEQKNSYVIEQFHAQEIIEFEIPVQAMSDQRIYLYVTYPDKDEKGNFLKYQTDEINVSRPEIQYQPAQTYVQVAIEYLLMPPISNGLVPVLVTFIVFSMEYRRKVEDEGDLKEIRDAFKKDIKQGIATFTFSFFILLVIFTFFSWLFEIGFNRDYSVFVKWVLSLFTGIVPALWFSYRLYLLRIEVAISIKGEDAGSENDTGAHAAASDSVDVPAVEESGDVVESDDDAPDGYNSSADAGDTADDESGSGTSDIA